MQLCRLGRFDLNPQQLILPCGYQIIWRIGDKRRVPPQLGDDGSSEVFAHTPDLHLIGF